jgi:hypothetical protein
VRDRPHRSYTKTIIIVAVAVLVGCLGLGSMSVASYMFARSRATPEPLKSAVSKDPIYRKLPSACSLPASVVRGLVPDPEQANANDQAERADKGDGARTHCHWGISVAEGKRRAETRELLITATAYVDDYATGGEQAKRSLDSLLETAGKNAGATGGDSTFGPARPLAGIGQEAFAQDSVTRAGYTYGGTVIWVLLDNVVLEISYHGSDDTRSRERPMSAEEAARNAMTAAREFVKLLGSCPDCRR